MIYPHTFTRAGLLPLAACTLLLCLLPPALAQQAPSGGGSSPVRLSFTAFDKDQQAVTSLRREDIRVLEDGVPQQLATFERQVDQPLSIIVMLDMSTSQARIVPVEKQVARNFVDSFAGAGRDSVGVITFTSEASLEQELTGDLEQVRRAIDGLKFVPPGNFDTGALLGGAPAGTNPNVALTAVWDAVWLASEELGARAGADTRRLIILITDGQDTGSKYKLNEVVERALKSGVAVYSIGGADKDYGGLNKGELRKLSERTGGQAFFPEKRQDLQAVFAEMQQRLRSQYLVSYSPAAAKPDDRLRKIKIEIINPDLRKQGVRLSHPEGYYAGKG
jgi:Ca-activated chloride channel family protein